jgi:hypothetical protein
VLPEWLDGNNRPANRGSTRSDGYRHRIYASDRRGHNRKLLRFDGHITVLRFHFVPARSRYRCNESARPTPRRLPLYLALLPHNALT